MTDFSQRSREAEIIDHPERVSAEEMEATLRELRLVNRWLGGAQAVLRPLARLLERLSANRGGRPVRVLDFGSGAADIPTALVRQARRRSIPIRVTAVDFNHQACRLARAATADYPEIEVVRADVFDPCFRSASCDLALFSAFLHHFSDRQIEKILRQSGRVVGGAVLINDLQRSRWAYLGIRALTALFSRSAAVKNDGPLSVLKGFRKHELREILARAGFADAEITWRWAFRYSALVDLGIDGSRRGTDRAHPVFQPRNLKQNGFST